MPSFQTIRASNARLNSFPSRITALFVGGTSGIGQSTLRQLARHTNGQSLGSSPRLTAYIVGRSAARAKPFLNELQSLSPHSKFHFLEADVALMKNVDKVCEEVKAREEKLDYLFMTPGGISIPLKGRDDTTEGLDRLFALRYYARMRFTSNLLPLLSKPNPNPNPNSSNSRVISIYGAGFETPLNTSDLSLSQPQNFTLLNSYKHSITMTSLAMAYLAKQNPSVSFIHAFPGLVRSNIYRNSFPGPVAAVYEYVLWPLMWPFSVGVEEVGERGVYYLTAGDYPARNGGLKGIEDVSKYNEQIARGLDGVTGSGAYLVNWDGEVRKQRRVLDEYREKGVDEEVWRHTMDVLEGAVRR